MAKLLKLAAFSVGETGGNPAGVWIGDRLPDEPFMRKTAAELAFSETVFAAPCENHWIVRYFSPGSEVPFCGHATIALGAALASERGTGSYWLRLRHGVEVPVFGTAQAGRLHAEFMSPRTESASANHLQNDALALFGLGDVDLDKNIPAAIIQAGATHLMLALKNRATLREATYSLERGRAFMAAHQLVTIALVHSRNGDEFDARNAFASGGVYEDPATGAAAAAFAGYLRDIGRKPSGRITIYQGEDMGIPCRLQADYSPSAGAPVKVSGTVRTLE